jgi:DNA replication protein DnaC
MSSEAAARTEPDMDAIGEKLRTLREANRASTSTSGAGPAPGAPRDGGTLTLVCPDCYARRQFPAPRTGEQTKRCDECHDRREAERKAADEAAREARTAAEAGKRSAGLLDNLLAAGVNTADLGSATLDSFRTAASGPEPIAAAREFLAEARVASRHDPVRGLYLHGPTGSGKSHIAVGIVRELLLDPTIPPESIVYDHSLRLIGRIQRTYSTQESADEVLDRRINARVWILDDLGTEAPSADVVRRLTEIFTERAMRPTVVTSNYAPGSLEARNAEMFRVVSRFGSRYFRTIEVRGRTDGRFRVA